MTQFEISPIELLALRKASIVLKALGAKMDTHQAQQEAKALGEVCNDVADRWEIKLALEPQGGAK